MVNLAAVIAFWRKKDSQPAPERERIIPLPQLSPNPDVGVVASKEQVDRARDTLKVLRLERQIIGSAVATIYESHTKGLISTVERDRLLQKYKIDLSGLEGSIDENQRIVNLYDLEVARGELEKNFRAKLAEIEAQIKSLRSGGPPARTNTEQQKHNPGSSSKDSGQNASEDGDKKPRNEQDQQITDAEKRIEQIREEILKAMDRLEQIESEG